MPLNAAQAPDFYIGHIPVYGDKILSPMSGFSDLPFRSICRAYGSAISYTEFVAVEAILHDNSKALKRLAFDPAERPVTFQIFGADVALIVRAALKIQTLGPDIIDVNMGCSARTVAGRGAGAGLLKTPGKIGQIFAALVKQLSVPVTGKIRLGWDEHSLNYLEVAKIMADNGAAAVAVHGRTKQQAYRGQANWDAIAEIRQAVHIPVIGNGDAQTVEDVAHLKAHTGCPAVMIGRAAIGNPWIFAGKNAADVTLPERTALIRRHLQTMLAFYGPDHGLVLFRKHVAKYIRGLRGAARARHQLLRCRTTAEFVALVEALEAHHYRAEPAAA
ncbi:MAG: tRNA dihydrouridine synthase DusB [Anaerolineae bacterium]